MNGSRPIPHRPRSQWGLFAFAYLFVLLAFLLPALTGCTMLRGDGPPLNLGDQAGAIDESIRLAARTTQRLCQNPAPGAACAEGAFITSEARDQIRERLQAARDANAAGQALLDRGLPAEAETRIGEARRWLALAEEIIGRYE